MVKRLLKRAYEGIPLKRQMFEALRLLRPPERVYRHLHFTGPFEVDIDERRGFMIEHLGTIVENELFWSGLGGHWESYSNRIWVRLCDGQDGTIVDAGANTGVYSLIASAVAAPGADIIAFEPLARIARYLRQNIALNSATIHVEELALSDHDGHSIIHDFPGDLAYSASLERPFPGASCAYEVETAQLDTFMAKAGKKPVIACKIDVEGHEPAVLRGMVATLRRDAPPLLIEILDDDAGRRIERELADMPYAYWNIDENAGLIPAKRLTSLGGDNWNMLLCRPDDFEARNLQQFVATEI